MLKRILFLGSAELFSKIVAFISTFLLAKLLSVNEYGAYNFYISFFTLTGLIFVPVLNSYTRDFYDNDFEVKNSYDFSVISHSLLLLPLFVFFSWLYFEAIDFLTVTIFVAFYFLQQSIVFFLSGTRKIKSLGFYNLVVNSSLLMGLSVLILFFDVKESGLLIQVSYGSAFLVSLIFFRFQKYPVNLSFCLSSSVEEIKKSKYLVFYCSILPLISFTDLWFVERLMPKEELGLYAFSLKIYLVALVLLNPILAVIRTGHVDVMKSGMAALFIKKNILKVISVALIFCISGGIVFELMLKWFFSEYQGSRLAGLILISSAFCSYVFVPFSFTIALKLHRSMAFLALISLTVNILGNYILIPYLGIVGAAVSTLIAQIIINGGGFLISMNYFKRVKVNA